MHYNQTHTGQASLKVARFQPQQHGEEVTIYHSEIALRLLCRTVLTDSKRELQSILPGIGKGVIVTEGGKERPKKNTERGRGIKEA